jgi:hypothetical protein
MSRILPEHRTKRSNPCRVCEGTSYCLNFEDKTLCTRVESERPSSAEKMEGWWHPLPGESWPDYKPGKRVEREEKPQETPRAGLAVRSKVYSFLIGNLTLIQRHREHLEGPKRQLTPEQIDRREYRTLWSGGGPADQEKAAELIAMAASETFGDLHKVPGFGTRTPWRSDGPPKIMGALCLSPRILIPVRSVEGLIEGFQMMDPAPRKGDPKYLWFSGVGEDGAGIGKPLHVARPLGELTKRDVIITEGPLKADIIADQVGIVTVAFQGVKAIDWDLLGRTIDALSPPRVLLALDADRKRNKDVGKANEDLCTFFTDRNQAFLVADWDEEAGKGLDDLLLAGFRPNWVPPEAPEEEPEEEPEAGMDARAFTELSFVVAAWNCASLSKVLAAFHLDRWAHPPARSAANAIGTLVKAEREVDSVAVAEQMRMQGAFSHYQRVAEFARDFGAQIQPGQRSTLSSFKEAVSNDAVSNLLTSTLESVGTVPAAELLTALMEGVSDMVATTARRKTLTLKEAIVDYIEREGSGELEKSQIKIPLIHKAIGPCGGGDVVFICGPPKIGKSGVLDEMIEGMARQGDPVLYGQLELRVDQICERKISRLLGKSCRGAKLAEKYGLMANGRLDHLENVLLTPKCTSLEEYRTEVTSILAQNPQIKAWATDYSEMLQSFDPRADQLSQTEAVSDFKKKTATAFDVLGLLLTQPNQSYYSDCRKAGENKPKLEHWKRGSKFRQDAHALCFIHSPHKFEPRKYPEDYLEFHIQLARAASTGRVDLKVNREAFAYRAWEGESPRFPEAPEKASEERSDGLEELFS